MRAVARGSGAAPTSSSRRAASASSTTSCSSGRARRIASRAHCACSGTSMRRPRSTEMRGDAADPVRALVAALRPGADLWRRRAGGRRPTAPSARAECVPIYNALDPATHHPGRARCRASTATSPSSATGCRIARRASRNSSCAPAAHAARRSGSCLAARLGRQDTARRTCSYLGHVCTERPQRVQLRARGGAQCQRATAWRASASRRRRGCSKRPAPVPA